MAEEPPAPTPFEALYAEILSASSGGLSSYFLNSASRWARLSHTAHLGINAGSIASSSGDNNQIAAIAALLKGTRYALATTNIPLTTPSAPAAVSVGVASGVLIAANANRRYLCIVNTSANYVSLAFGGAATLYSGITLSPNGGSYEMSEGTGNLYTGEVRAIASAAASNVGLQEII